MINKIKEWWTNGTDNVIKVGIVVIILGIVLVLMAQTGIFDGLSGYVSPRG